ncbi:MAG: DUF3313 domain-containing protein [Deltaproteobacteria bacterium]|nr:DUF3313 domain-containing protein [Deltaproteobacteria bacterium]
MAGCAASGMKDVKQSGFLRDYSQLKPGGNDRAALVYIKTGVDFKKYDSVMFERVTVYLSPKAENRAIDPTVMKELTDYYQNALFNAVKDGYKVVDRPGPGVLRVRVAITEMKPSNPTANTMSTIIPVGMVVSAATKAVSDDNLGTGEAATEMELLDAQSGERLAAAVDRRQGGKMAFRGKWEDTKQAFDFWAKRFRERLDEARK